MVSEKSKKTEARATWNDERDAIVVNELVVQADKGKRAGGDGSPEHEMQPSVQLPASEVSSCGGT